MRNRYLNKATAFSLDERTAYGLHGLLPPAVETLDTQLERVGFEYEQKTSDIERHIFLRLLQQRSSVLFYAFVDRRLEALLPIVYTPTVGLACQEWSRIYRREQGLYLSWPDRHRVDEFLENAIGDDEIDIVVATDGERVLGLGDLGVGGMGIPIGKLALYTAAGGIDPARTLPVMLDAGTDNEALLSDPLYLGWRHQRVRDDDYDELVDLFVAALKRRLPNVLLQWEDFAQRNATRLLDRHRSVVCSFNDDIQGTAAVTAAAILGGMRASGTPPIDLRLVVVGAGSAGTGIARQVVRAMVHAGLPEAEALGRCWLVDRNGLLRSDMADLVDIQHDFARSTVELAGWPRDADGDIGLVEVIERVSPHALVGVSGQPGLFTEEAIRAMAQRVEHPIVLPLSNPTPRAEAIASDVVRWTDGRALVGTGSPFDPVPHGARMVEISQVNNVHVFPGIGLGVLAVGARAVTDNMLTVAADAVGALSPAAASGTDHPLLPPISASRQISRQVGVAVAMAAMADGVATRQLDSAQLSDRLDELVWTAEYHALTT